MFERFKKWLDTPTGSTEPKSGEPDAYFSKPEYQPVTLERVEAEIKRTGAKKARAKKVSAPKELSPKEKATAAGEPYVSVLSMEIDPNNMNNGAFELDWNSKFAANLARGGYQRKPGESEDIIVDRWFTEVCRNIVLEMYEQGQADPDNREPPPLTKPITEVPPRIITQKPLDNGRSEIS